MERVVLTSYGEEGRGWRWKRRGLAVVKGGKGWRRKESVGHAGFYLVLLETEF
jgi:hypothetical protein